MRSVFIIVSVLYTTLSNAQHSQQNLFVKNSLLFSNNKQVKFRITAYGAYILRIQAVRNPETFFPDDKNEMVESHKLSARPVVSVTNKSRQTFQVTTTAKNTDKPMLEMNSITGVFSFLNLSGTSYFLKSGKGIWWSGDTIHISFQYDSAEHFTGLGHGYFGREESIDLANKIISRNYGTEHEQQAPLIVPFFLSSKGYGIFLNSTFPNSFNFGKAGEYELSVAGGGQMDFFFIQGPEFSKILDRYTMLTGRPRLPLKAFFGLALSDKGNDHTSADPSDEKWWKKKVGQHRAAGFPLDHIVNDNRWRAGGGQRCESYFAWDSVRYPDPAEYARWLKENGLITTLDLNRCIAARSAGWLPSFNIPQPQGIAFNTSAPDLTKKEVREWFWNLFWKKSFDPKLGYPGDALWIDEFDEMGKAPPDMKFSDGTTWLERRNYWFFLIAKALVQQGWDKSFKATKRPFVWVRGMTAGGQRYATLWSGDIKPTYDDMKTQVRAMQLAGLSGFPFWGHDAGGFYNWEKQLGPDDDMYRQWSMAFGSFTPFWKPHGVGQSRWPLDRPSPVQKDAHYFSELRYKLIPYLYTYAHVASETGMPLAHAMVIDHQNEPLAWKSDLQYMWGNEFLVAPNCSGSSTLVSVWLPPGKWYDFRNDSLIEGGGTISYASPLGTLPLFVKQGSIIPMADYALSTAFIPIDSLTLHVYTGRNAQFTLYEDDGVTENYRQNQKRITTITYDNAVSSLTISAAKGDYPTATKSKVYRIEFHGMDKPLNWEMNGKKIKAVKNDLEPGIPNTSVWNSSSKVQSVFLERHSTNKQITLNTQRL